jgi:hypothetical protein
MLFFDFAVEHLVLEDKAIKSTMPFWKELTALWADAWTHYNNIPEETRHLINPNPKAGCLNSIAGNLALQRFSDREDEGLRICTKLQFVKLYIKKTIVLRFNSLTSNMVVRGIKASPQKESYFRQEPVDGMLNSATRFTVGYRADAANAKLDRVAISLQVGEACAYYFFIDRQDEAAMPVPQPQVPPTVPPPTSPKTQSQKLRRYIH